MEVFGDCVAAVGSFAQTVEIAGCDVGGGFLSFAGAGGKEAVGCFRGGGGAFVCADGGDGGA